MPKKQTPQVQAPQSYFFKVGEAGRKRLEILNSVCNPQSLKFLQEKGLLKSGIRVLELGCGIGGMVAAIAEQILPGGIVDAIDNSEEQLGIARALIAERNIKNVNLIKMSALNLSRLQFKYDLIYCRLLLMHLRTPEMVIQQAKPLLKEDGFIVSEDSVADSYYCRPDSEIFERWKRARTSLFHFDIYFGNKASLLYGELGFSKISLNVVQPELVTAQQREFLRASFCEHRERLVGTGKEFSTEEEAVAFEKKLEELENSNSNLGFMKMFQVCAGV